MSYSRRRAYTSCVRWHFVCERFINVWNKLPGQCQF